MTRAPVHPSLLAILRDPEREPPGALDAPAWEALVDDAVAGGLGPWLHRWLKRAGLGDRLPAGPATRLETHAFGVAARNMVLAGELEGILRGVEAAGLVAAPLRGAALAELLYGDVTARPMGDVDLLVREDDLPAVAATLRGLEYRELDRSPGFARAFSYTLEFFKDRHGWVTVEPHWTIAYPPFVDRVDMAEVWRRCGRARVVGVETWALGGEELLLHLCLHVTHRDGTAPLLWLYDIDRLVRRDAERLDWVRLVSLARAARLEYPLGRVLGEVRSLFATPIPDRAVELGAEPARTFEGRLVRLLAGGANVDGKESLAVLLAIRGWRARARYALALLFPSAEFMRIHYSLTCRRQLGFAYLRRVCSLSLGGLRGLLSILAAP